MYLAKGNFSEAMTYLEKAEELGGGTSDVLTNKGIIAARKGATIKSTKII